ncbi:restriction endonuclease subunit S [Oceanicola sp. S124]|uniref:restriction endonuclease subunit S n=1 Tax=Oceanicola sp. S124 TaxID=1042378 RepID=UPI0002558A11|nr:restriction endonuclease subunit S [Oceanicola sp. S124]
MRGYPDYKESGVSRIGQIPSHWRTGGLKNIFRIVGGSTPQSGEATYWDGEINWVTPADLSKLTGRGISRSLRTITESGLNACGSSLVPEGSLILSTRAPIGSLAIAKRELCTNQGCKALVPAASLEPTFFYFVLSVSTEALNVRGRGTTFLELSGDALGTFPVPLPPLPEQQAIAAFLDRETGKIDALVEEQRRLIALLKEKRQAVISHAVTKGLDPTAPLKPSGIDWLGDIPGHWEVMKLGRTLTRIEQGWSPVGDDREPEDDEVGVLKLSAIKSGVLKAEERKAIPRELVRERLEHLRLQEGDLLFTRANTPDLVGDVAIVPEGLSDTIFSDLVYRLKLRSEHLSNSFLCLALRSTGLRTQIKADARGSSMSMAKLSHGHIRAWYVAVPPLHEQLKIVEYCREQEIQNLALTAEATRAIALLQERRAALISAAVTGKIDVRDSGSDEEAA